jgi:hypothetical protein
MYVLPNFKTKKALKEAVAAGKAVTILNPSPISETPKNGRVFVEGPHFPKPHTWYAQVVIKDGKVTKVK